MLTLKVSVHVLNKAGTEARELEDAYAFDKASRRAAVADGASDAFEAGSWARLLVSSFVHAPPDPDIEAFRAWLAYPVRAWHALVEWDELPWYAEQKARQVGGLATLLGFCLMPGEENEGHWQALAVGDCCLLHLRANTVLDRFPLTCGEAFGTTPALLGTCASDNTFGLEEKDLRLRHGTCRPGDVFLLATDALAEWLYAVADLENATLGFPNWGGVLDVVQHDFKLLVEELRAKSAMRNDDVTLLVVRVGTDKNSSLPVSET